MAVPASQDCPEGYTDQLPGHTPPCLSDKGAQVVRVVVRTEHRFQCVSPVKVQGCPAWFEAGTPVTPTQDYLNLLPAVSDCKHEAKT